MTAATPQGSPPPFGLLQILAGAQTTQLAYVMAKLDLADLLRDGPRSSAQLAIATQTHPAALKRVLRGLTSIGLCKEVHEGHFALTGLGEYLRTDRPDSLHARALFNGELLFPLWGDLLRTVQTGEPAAGRVWDMSIYEYLAEHPQARAVFDRAMASAGQYRLPPVVRAYDFSRFGIIVDVGGGNGALLVLILSAYPQPRGVVFDFPTATERARENIQAAGLADRCTAVGGDAREGVPAGGDAYILSNVVSDMADAEAIATLKNCRAAMGNDAKLLLINSVMPAGGGSSAAAMDEHKYWQTVLTDLIMLTAIGGGRVRTEAE